jgi:nucleoside-diphosphate-sugar epimerase
MGFLGSTLAIRLAQLGAEVTILDSMLPGFGGNLVNIAPIEDRVRVNFSDLRDPYALNFLVQGPRVIFNLAAQVSHVNSIADPLTDLDINARAQLLLLEACRLHNPTVRVIHTSSRHVYGRAQYLPVDERHPVEPLDGYSVSKLAGEQYHRLYGAVHHLRMCVLRLTNLYGPRQNNFDCTGVFMRRAAAQQPLTVYGDGAQLRDYLYVDDVCEALLVAGARDELLGQVYNVGGAGHCSIREFADRLGHVAGVPVETVPFPPERASIEIGDFYTDDTKFRRATGWSPRVGLEEGIQQTYAYFAAHRDHYLH